MASQGHNELNWLCWTKDKFSYYNQKFEQNLYYRVFIVIFQTD